MQSVISMKCDSFIRILALCILLLHVVRGFPTTRTEKSAVESEEKQFPNGTVVGKYAYLDKEGNPVQVKYYADDSSYGVELNSYRVLQHKDGITNPQPEQQKRLDDGIPNIHWKETPADPVTRDGMFDTVEAIKYPSLSSGQRYNTKPEFPEYINKEPLKNVYKKSKYSNPDFEIYSKDEIDEGQCGGKNEKVHVYNFVKEGRKTREVPEEEEPQFCEF